MHYAGRSRDQQAGLHAARATSDQGRPSLAASECHLLQLLSLGMPRVAPAGALLVQHQPFSYPASHMPKV
jgi:hypothetical protein